MRRGREGLWTEIYSYMYFLSVFLKFKILKFIINVVYRRERREVKGSGIEIGIRKRAEMERKMEGLEKVSYQWAVI